MSVLSILMMLAVGPAATTPDDRADIGKLLDAFHASAAKADEAAYFGCFADGAVFLGTDASERWTLAEFRAYAHPHFSEGKGWTYVPQERHVELVGGAHVAWFDEVLKSEKHGLCRGTGVVARTEQGWRVAQYSLTFLVPNDAAAAVVEAIRATPVKKSP